MGQALPSLHAGSRVGVSLDSDHCLHLHVDGQHQGMVARDVPQPCYALFELLNLSIKQVRHVLFTLLVTAKCKCAGYCQVCLGRCQVSICCWLEPRVGVLVTANYECVTSLCKPVCYCKVYVKVTARCKRVGICNVLVTVKCVLRLLQGVSALVYAMCWLLSSTSVSVNAECKCLVTAKNKCVGTACHL